MLLALFNAFKKISPRDLAGLIVIFTLGTNIIKGACADRKGGLLKPMCRGTNPLFNLWLDTSDLRFIVGSVLLVYTLSQVYDAIRPALVAR